MIFIFTEDSDSVGELLIGSRFNVYIRSRQSDVWIAVHLEVEDDCYDDGM